MLIKSLRDMFHRDPRLEVMFVDYFGTSNESNFFHLLNSKLIRTSTLVDFLAHTLAINATKKTQLPDRIRKIVAVTLKSLMSRLENSTTNIMDDLIRLLEKFRLKCPNEVALILDLINLVAQKLNDNNNSNSNRTVSTRMSYREMLRTSVASIITVGENSTQNNDIVIEIQSNSSREEVDRLVEAVRLWLRDLLNQRTSSTSMMANYGLAPSESKGVKRKTSKNYQASSSLGVNGGSGSPAIDEPSILTRLLRIDTKNSSLKERISSKYFILNILF